MGRFVDFFDGDIGRPEALMDIYNATPGTDDFVTITVGGAPGNDKHFRIGGDLYRTGQLGTDTTVDVDGDITATQTVIDAVNHTNNNIVIKKGEVILIDSEIMYVTDATINNITVVRGAFSTTAATHTDTTDIEWHGTRPEAHNRLLVPSESALAVANYEPIVNAINFWRDRGEAKGNYRAIAAGSGAIIIHSPENSAVDVEIPVTKNAAGEETTTLADNSLENTTPVGTTALSGGVKPFSQRHFTFRKVITDDDVTATSVSFVSPFDVVGVSRELYSQTTGATYADPKSHNGNVSATGRLVTVALGTSSNAFADGDLLTVTVYG